MTLKNLSKMAAVAAVLASGFASCSSDDDANATIVAGTQEAIDQACADWKTARADWENSEAFLFGAADEYSIDPHTDTWPVDANALANTLRDASAMADIDNFVTTANSGILGYHGLEYVLFRNGSARPVTQITDLEYKYICAVAKDLYNATATLEAAWDDKESNSERKAIAIEYLKNHNKLDDDGNVTEETSTYTNFGKEFKNPGAGKTYETALDATLEIIAGCQDIIGEVGDSKIGLPHTGEDESYIESPYAYNSITDFYDNIESCQYALYGAFGATAPTANSLIYFCKNTNNTALLTKATNVESKLNNALAKIKAMKYPFALYYTDSSCQAAMDALEELDEALDALKTELSGYSSDATVQAQCQVINENYVDNVIVATYRSLADNAYKLWQSVIKIQK